MTTAGSTGDAGVDEGHGVGTLFVDFTGGGIVAVVTGVTGVVAVMRLLGTGGSTA